MKINFDPRDLSRALLNWWRYNGRTFPWRETKDPYRLLIAEVLLHRTRADQVVPAYDRLLRTFPTVRDLAAATPEHVREILEPLGLFWRDKLLCEMARRITTRYGSAIPSDRESLESLPGVSRYIASATRCFAFGYPEPLLDTNTVRVLSRFFALPATDSSRRSIKFRKLMEELVDPEFPREFNYAMLDLGALVCRPRNPLCEKCPVRRFCAYGNRKVAR